jgi:deoxyribonucleoside regulator
LGDVSAQHDETLAHELTRVMAANFGGDAYYLTAPALVENETVRNVLMNAAAIRTVTRLYSSVRVALIGIGEIVRSPLVLGGLISAEEAIQLAREGVVGDICGYFFDVDGRFRSTIFDNRAIGISVDELRKCEMVVAVAGGEDKVLPLLGVLRTGVVNFVISDHVTMRRVVEQAEASPKLLK